MQAPAVPAGAPLPRRLSPTALDRYRSCPRQFHFAHIQKAHREEPGGPNLVVANAVHHALERFYGLPVAARQPELLGRALRSVWRSHTKPDSFLDRHDERRWGLQALDLLDGHAARQDLSAVPLAREVWVRHRLAGGIELYGKVDRIDPMGDGLRIIDYKTGRWTLEDDELPHDSAAMLYAVAAQATYGRPVLRVCFQYLATGEQAIWDTSDPEEVDAARLRLSAHVDCLKAERDWPALPGEACRFCAFTHLCPARGATAVEDLEVDEELVF